MQLRSSFLRVEPAVTSIVVFGSLYFGIVGAVLLVQGPLSLKAWQWTALSGVVLATIVTRRLRRSSAAAGLTGNARSAAAQLLAGVLTGAFAIVLADLAIYASGFITHSRGEGFSASELLLVFLPAVLHEELLFRGLIYGELQRISRFASAAVTTALFTISHLGNAGVSPLAVVNLMLGGWMLAEARNLHERLWFPIGLHLAWNMVSGPVLGHEVSGFSPESLFTAVDRGSELMNGGRFGIEGSLAITAAEALLIVWLRNRRRRAGMLLECEGNELASESGGAE